MSNQKYNHLPKSIEFRRGWHSDSKEWRWRCWCGAKTDTSRFRHLDKENQRREALRHHFLQHWPSTWQVRGDPRYGSDQNPLGVKPLFWLADQVDHLFRGPVLNRTGNGTVEPPR